MKRDISRQSYTKRILEIVSSIHKQREEIERVIVDMKMTQKTMNQLKGRADRTFTAVDEIMFQVRGLYYVHNIRFLSGFVPFFALKHFFVGKFSSAGVFILCCTLLCEHPALSVNSVPKGFSTFLSAIC